jgi:hypothetical protein
MVVNFFFAGTFLDLPADILCTVIVSSMLENF